MFLKTWKYSLNSKLSKCASIINLHKICSSIQNFLLNAKQFNSVINKIKNTIIFPKMIKI